MESHPFTPPATTLTALSTSVLDVSFESTTVYYSVAPISYTIDVSSSIPYRDVITSENSALSQQISTFSTNACSNVSGNAEERYDDILSDICNESTAEMLQLHRICRDLQIDTAAQQLLLSPTNMKVNVAAQRLPLSSLQTQVVTQQLPSCSKLPVNVPSQSLPSSSTVQSNVTAQQLLLPSNQHEKIPPQQLPLSSNLHEKTETQSLSLPSTKSLQGTDEFQKNLSSIHKIRLLHDQATHYARLAQDAWEEARAIASSLNMPPPSLPDAVDLMTHNYLKYRKQWNSLKTVEERENITPNLSQAGNLENPVSLSRFQSISKWVKPTRSTSSVLDPNFNKLPTKISRIEEDFCRNANAKLMIDQQLPTTSLQRTNPMEGLHLPHRQQIPAELINPNLSDIRRSYNLQRMQQRLNAALAVGKKVKRSQRK
ncbi:hypothetical protein QQG55_21425 [Brugia pahangi]